VDHDDLSQHRALNAFSALPFLADTLLVAHRALPDAQRARPLGLCLSAGADSSALLLAASCVRRELGPEIVGLHARHGLRGAESEADRHAVADLCARERIALIEVDATIPAGANLEARARTARYRALREAFPGILVTAHHATDQAETVVLRLLRGAGPAGLRGIHRWREDGTWRPFLDVPGSRLKDACAEARWTPRLDSSNDDFRHLRNWVRHRWLPSQALGTEAALAALAQAAEDLAPRLQDRLDALATTARLQIDDTGFRLDLSAWKDCAMPDPELDLLLERCWTRSGRRPWARLQRERLVVDVLSGPAGRRLGGQRELALWGGRILQVRA